MVNAQHLRNLESLTSEELERIVENSGGKYATATREVAAHMLVLRLTLTVASKHFNQIVIPRRCGACGAQSVVDSTTVSESEFGKEAPDTVSITVPLCAECAKPIKWVEAASRDNGLLKFLGCFGGITGVAMLIALIFAVFTDLIEGIWVAIFGIPAVIAALVWKAMEYAIVRSLPSDQRWKYDRAKTPIHMLHMGYQVQMTFRSAAFFAEFRQLNAHHLNNG